MILVGIDGSESSRAALRFALAEARQRGTSVRAVGVWHVPVTAYGSAFVPPNLKLREDLETAARDGLQRAIADTAAGDVEVETAVREGQPADVLLKEAQTAELLVVGSRGLGGFRGLLLGSVSQQCAHHAPCPLVIVPRARDLAPDQS